MMGDHHIQFVINNVKSFTVCRFGNWFVPIIIGALDMAFPRLNNISFWLCGVQQTPNIFNISVFKTDSFNHSDIHPYLNKIINLK
jgi:heme/copper-type cytochrome/quinol oxidase subunit 1